jgi:hypothetical protein
MMNEGSAPTPHRAKERGQRWHLTAPYRGRGQDGTSALHTVPQTASTHRDGPHAPPQGQAQGQSLLYTGLASRCIPYAMETLRVQASRKEKRPHIALWEGPGRRKRPHTASQQPLSLRGGIWHQRDGGTPYLHIKVYQRGKHNGFYHGWPRS